MNDKDLISIIIPTYKRSDMLQNAIHSVLNQSYDNIEIIIVDDNDPNSEDRMKTEICMQKYISNKNIKYIKHTQNKGGCAARNTGIKNSEGKYISFLDDDDYWDKEFLSKLVTLFSYTSKDTGAVYCNYYIGMHERIFYSKKEQIFYSGNVFNKLLSGWCPASTSFFLIKRECFESVGLFDEELKSFQDYDMWLRIAREYEFDYTEQRLVIKYEHNYDQVSINPYKRKDGLNVLDKKLRSSLNESNYKKFHTFKKIHESLIAKNMILYNKYKKTRMNYMKLYIEYIRHGGRNRKDLLLLPLVIIGGIRVNEFFENSKFILFKHRYVFVNQF